jgi:alkyl hydroperoxide reductase subunit F
VNPLSPATGPGVLEFLPELKTDQVLVQHARARDNISIVTRAVTRWILADAGRVTGIEHEGRVTGTIAQRQLDGVFVQIGLVPNTEFLAGVVGWTSQGEVRVNERGETSGEGIFACGDVTTIAYKQIVVAMGEGSKAVLSAFEYVLRQPAAGAARAA